MWHKTLYVQHRSRKRCIALKRKGSGIIKKEQALAIPYADAPEIEETWMYIN